MFRLNHGVELPSELPSSREKQSPFRNNADQLRSLEINSLIFSNSWRSLTVLNQTFAAHLLLWFRPKQPKAFVIRKTRQPLSTSKFVAETIIFLM